MYEVMLGGLGRPTTSAVCAAWWVSLVMLVADSLRHIILVSIMGWEQRVTRIINGNMLSNHKGRWTGQGACYDFITRAIFWQLFSFLRVRSRTLCAQWTCRVLRTRLPCIPASCITCHRLVYSYIPVPVSRVFLLVPVWTDDSSPVTCMFPVSSFVLSTRTLTVPACVFLLLSRRLVYAYDSRLCLSFCSLLTRLSSRYFWTLTRHQVISLSCIFVLVSRILSIYTGWRCGSFPIFNLLCNHPKGVTCEIPRTLLVLSRSLAKATALRS